MSSARDMKAKPRIFILVGALLIIASGTWGQCAHGTVYVQGKVENLRSYANAQVLVILETAKGSYSRAADIATGHFDVAIDFSYLKSWSPLSGHRCSNVPKAVDVELSKAGKVLLIRKLKISVEFESKKPLSYTLKRELILDASGDS